MSFTPNNNGTRVAMVVFNNVLNDNRVLKTAQSIADMGCEVHLFGTSRSSETKTIHREGYQIHLLPNPKTILKNGKTNTLRLDFLLFQFSFELHKYLKEIRPNILHTHDMYGLIIGENIYRQKQNLNLNYKWVHDLHEYVTGLTIIPEPLRLYALDAEKKFIHLPDHLITVSPPLADALKEDYKLKEPVHVVMNVPVYGAFQPDYQPTIKEKLKLPPESQLMVYTGQAKPARGLEELVEVLPEFKTLHAAVVTNNQGEYIDGLKDRAKKLNCHDRLHFLPYVPPAEVPSFIQDATFGVFPLKRYGNADMALPNKLFDYLHGRLPVVVSDTLAMAEFVRKYEVGEVYSVGDRPGLVKAIKTLLENYQSLKTKVQNSEELLRKYCWENQNQILIDTYQNFIDETKERDKKPNEPTPSI